MNTFFPLTGTEADWNAAYYRLEDYFRSLRVVNKVHQSQIILHILEKAAAIHARNPTQNPTVLAMEEARGALGHWFENLLGPRPRMVVEGLISLLAIDTAERWPIAFLSEDPPEDFRREIQESDIRAGPDLRVSSMTPRPIDVSPLLDPIHFPEALEKIRWGVALFTTLFLVIALSASWYFIVE